MGWALVWLHVIPALIAGVVAVVAAGALWLRAPRSSIPICLAALLVFWGHVALLSSVAVLPDGPTVAARLLPMFEVAATATGVVLLLFLLAPSLSKRRLDALLSSTIGGGVAFAMLAVLEPALFWSSGGPTAPLARIVAFRTLMHAVLAAVFFVRWSNPTPRLARMPRGLAGLLSFAFLAGSWPSILAAAWNMVGSFEPASYAPFVAVPGHLLGLVPLGATLAYAIHRARDVHDGHLVRRLVFGACAPVATFLVIVPPLHLAAPVNSFWVASALSAFASFWALVLPVVVFVSIRRRTTRHPARAPAPVHGSQSGTGG